MSAVAGGITSKENLELKMKAREEIVKGFVGLADIEGRILEERKEQWAT